MSRVGRKPIPVPETVTVRLQGQAVHVQGPKGALVHHLPARIQARLAEGVVTLTRADETARSRALHGLSRTLVHNMILGVTQGFTKELEIQGVGYRAQVAPSPASGPPGRGLPGPQTLTLQVGFSHPVTVPVPAGVSVETPKPTQVIVTGMDKALVGQVAASLRAVRPAEPYKGMGIRYAGEVVRRKAGKAVATKTQG